MNIFGILTMIGGLAMFLYGMSVMGGGLEKMSGGKLERILESLTSNPFKAVLLGAGVTAVIQSSSATTVMVVGFVNSGIIEPLRCDSFLYYTTPCPILQSLFTTVVTVGNLSVTNASAAAVFYLSDTRTKP